MSTEIQIRKRLHELGFSKKNDIEMLGIELTVCQFIVVVLSLISVIFLFVPIFFLNDIKFMVGFFLVSLICLIVGVWFWLKKAEICENPEEYE